MHEFGLSPQQQFDLRLRAHADRDAVAQQLAYPLDGVTAGQVESRLRELTERLEILRTGIRAEADGGPPVQLVMDAVDVSVAVHALPGISSAAMFDAPEAPLTNWRRGVSATGDAAWRVDIVQAHDQSCVVITADPLILDFRALQLLAVFLVDGDAAALAAEMQYADVAQWMHELVESPESPQDLDWWIKHLQRVQETADTNLGLQPSAVPGIASAFTPAIGLDTESFPQTGDFESALRSVWAGLVARIMDSASLRRTASRCAQRPDPARRGRQFRLSSRTVRAAAGRVGKSYRLSAIRRGARGCRIRQCCA